MMKKNINLDLTIDEKQLLKVKGVTQKSIPTYAVDEVITLLNASSDRAKVLRALVEFQSIPSIGIKFAQDLMLLGYYNLDSLKHKLGPELLDNYEKLMGCWTDPCVEDQFWLVVHHANNLDSKKQWWDFTFERKVFRKQHGYPINRPVKAWYDDAKGSAYFKSKEVKVFL